MDDSQTQPIQTQLATYLWNFADCLPGERDALTVAIEACLNFRSLRTDAASLPLSASTYRALKQACGLFKNTGQLALIRALQRSAEEILQIPFTRSESPVMVHWWAHVAGVELSDPFTLDSMNSELEEAAKSANHGRGLVTRPPTLTTAGGGAEVAEIPFAVDQIHALGRSILKKLFAARLDLPPFEDTESLTHAATLLATGSGVLPSDIRLLRHKRRASTVHVVEKVVASAGLSGGWQVPSAAAIDADTLKFIYLVKAGELRNGMFLVKFDDVRFLSSVLQVSDGRAVDDKCAIDLPGVAAWCLSTNGVQEYKDFLSKVNWPQTFLGAGPAPLVASGFAIPRRPSGVPPGESSQPPPFLAPPHTLFSAPGGSAANAITSSENAITSFMANINALHSKLEGQRSDVSISTLKRQSEAVGFRNCLRPDHLDQLALLCTAYEDLNSVTFLQAVRHAVGRDYARFPCFATADKAKAVVNVLFMDSDGKAGLTIDNCSLEPIKNTLTLARAVQVVGIFSSVLHNLPASYFADKNLPVPSLVDGDFLTVLLKPLVDALMLPPVIPEAGLGLMAVKFFLHSAEFDFQYWVVSEMLKGISNVINNPAGEALGWGRKTLISKLVPVCALPPNWKDVHDTWVLSRQVIRATPETPQKLLGSPTRVPNGSNPRGNKQRSPAKPEKQVTTPVKAVTVPQVLPVSQNTTTPPGPKVPGVLDLANRLCVTSLLFRVKLSPTKCEKGDCPYSHTKSPSKEQLALAFKVLKDDASIKAIKEKYHFDSM